VQRRRALEDIAKKRGGTTITLIHRQETMSLLGFPLFRYIDIDDAESILRAIRETPPDRPIEIILQPRDLDLLGIRVQVGVDEPERELMTLYPQPRGRPSAVEYAPGAPPPARPSIPHRREVPRPASSRRRGRG